MASKQASQKELDQIADKEMKAQHEDLSPSDRPGEMDTMEMTQVNWEQLEKRYKIVVEGNNATATKRGLFGGKPLFTATPILGTKAVKLKLTDGSQVDAHHDQNFSESNLADELKTVCLFTLAQWEMAQAQVAAEG